MGQAEVGKAGVVQSTSTLLIKQRMVVWLFALTVMGIIWSWIATVYLVRASSVAAAFVVCYLVYIWGPGRHAAEHMSWKPSLKRWSIWKHMADYFPARLIKTCDLDPQGHYLFTMVPHGIAACSGWIHFCTEATGFSEQFPGIDVRALTLEANFKAPLIREYVLLHGLRSVSHRSIRNILTERPGSSALLVPGGATESLLSAPGTCDTVLARRKGFVRVALQTGASLVPVVAFGENDMFDTFIAAPGSFADKALKLAKKSLGFATPIFWGVNVFGGWGILPNPTPLNTVVGKPIPMPKYEVGMNVSGLLPPAAAERVADEAGSSAAFGAAAEVAEKVAETHDQAQKTEAVVAEGEKEVCTMAGTCGCGAAPAHSPDAVPVQQPSASRQLSTAIRRLRSYLKHALAHLSTHGHVSPANHHSKVGDAAVSKRCDSGHHNYPHPKHAADPVLEALVDKYHALFMEAVQQLWDEHKERYAPHRVRDIRFV